MPIPTAQITGHVLMPNGAAPASGTIRAKLSQAASILDGADSERVASSVSVSLDAAGSVPAAFALAPNDALVPSGTYYLVEFFLVGPDGDRASWKEKWQIDTTPDPIDIGAVPRIGVVPGVAAGYAGAVSLSTLAAAEAARDAAIAAATIPLYTTATRPAAGASWARRLVIVRDADADSELHLCRQMADGSYEWIVVAF